MGFLRSIILALALFSLASNTARAQCDICDGRTLTSPDTVLFVLEGDACSLIVGELSEGLEAVLCPILGRVASALTAVTCEDLDGLSEVIPEVGVCPSLQATVGVPCGCEDDDGQGPFDLLGFVGAVREINALLRDILFLFLDFTGLEF